MAQDYDYDPSTDVDITGLEWWEVLQRLHRATKAVGPFAMNDRPLSDEHAMELVGLSIQESFNKGFDWVNGRPMKISFHTKHGRSWVRGANLYDRDAQFPAKVTISALRREKSRMYKARGD